MQIVTSRFFALFMSSALLLLVAHSALAQSIGERKGWRVIELDTTFNQTVKNLEDSVKGNKMLLVTAASASGGAKAQGITIPGNRIVGVFRNDYARRMLDASIAAGIEAPIRFYITENDDGTATLSYKLPSTVFAPYFEEGGDKLRALAAELDELFGKIADEAAKS